MPNVRTRFAIPSDQQILSRVLGSPANVYSIAHSIMNAWESRGRDERRPQTSPPRSPASPRAWRPCRTTGSRRPLRSSRPPDGVKRLPLAPSPDPVVPEARQPPGVRQGAGLAPFGRRFRDRACPGRYGRCGTCPVWPPSAASAAATSRCSACGAHPRPSWPQPPRESLILVTTSRPAVVA
jgi:hypothetical protein